MKLLTLGNTKTAKGTSKGILTFILHLAPAKLSGFNVCPMASKGCAAACLNTAGRGRFDRTQAARVRKTREFFENRDSFMAQLVKDIKAAVRKADREGYDPAIRLNGTSDIRWENMPVGGFPNLMAMFPTVQFYDYTKIANRKGIPANYHLTFSRSESNDGDVAKVLGTPVNIAVVFNVKKGAPLPAVWNGRTVIDGDVTDVRFFDPASVIVGLRSKGDGKHDATGFVVTV